MSDSEVLAAKITEQAATVRTLKAAKSPALPDALAALLKLKAEFKELTGSDFGAAPAAAAATAAAPATEPEGGKKKDKAAASTKEKPAKADSKDSKESKEAKEAKAKAAAAAALAAAEAEAAVKQLSGDEKFSFAEAEAETLAYWTEIDAFQQSLKFSEGRKEFTFYDGPPFATGTPHYGHILAGTIKDVVTRYAHQTGHHVERRFGWDCHGLPIEYEIDKTNNIKGPADVHAMGIDKYNALCRGIVMKYSGEWRNIMTKLGRWIDFDNDYKTLYPSFMESVWWVFKELFDKGLVYRGFKVMPFSTALATPLSNFEANQEMKEVVDPAVYVTFPLEGEDAALLAWTTTPWTLPSNLALCVHPDFEYAKFQEVATGKIYIALKSLVAGTKESLFKSKDQVVILDTFVGKTLVGKKYTPIFNYYPELSDRAYRVVCDTYVTADSGTGVVHNAPGHGEDDYRVCVREGIVDNTSIPCPVDDTGKFIAPVTDFLGRYVKEADEAIIAVLTQRGRMFRAGTVKHVTGFCWRSDTPLLRKTVDSWFVNVEVLKDKLIANNKATYWVPAAVKEGRFHNWLENARDWAISRNRFWGTPIPLWVSDDFEEVVCVGSIAELEALTGVSGITDLHRESIDALTIPSKQGKGALRRITQVFDCWFESGSMPYAQKHYPFEQKERFEKGFPADFIAEGVDQTRGWFYTMLVIGTALFDSAPWKNLIVNGLVLAADGRKMSKRLKNYPDPEIVIANESADALRLYLIDSPVVRAEDLRFQRTGVQSLIKDVFLPWLNSYRFFKLSVDKLEDTGSVFKFDDKAINTSSNLMDKWVLAYVQSLVGFTHKEMQGYRLYTVVPELIKFVDNLTNWYVRFNRKRLKGSGGIADCTDAVKTLGEVLLTMSKMMAPFTPFFSEWMYQRMRVYVPALPAQPAAGGSALAAWTPEQVGTWLGEQGLGQHTALFQQHRLSGKDLLDLSHADLQSVGIELCSDRKAVLRAVQVLVDANAGVGKATKPAVTEDASVHFQMLPQPKPEYANEAIERGVELMKRVIVGGRMLRDQNLLPTKNPLYEVVVLTKLPHALEDLRDWEEYIKLELNVSLVTLTPEAGAHNVKLHATPDFRTLGTRLKNDLKAVMAAIQELSQADLAQYEATRTITVLGHTLTGSDIAISYKLTEKAADSRFCGLVDGNLVLFLDVKPSEAMLDEGAARTIVNKIQKMRKSAGLLVSDHVLIHYTILADDAETHLQAVIDSQAAFFKQALNSQLLTATAPAGQPALYSEEHTVKTATLRLALYAA